MILGIPVQAFMAIADRADQRLVLCALVLGLAIIFGLLRVINFAHGAQYMLGAFIGYLLLATSASATGPR